MIIGLIEYLVIYALGIVLIYAFQNCCLRIQISYESFNLKLVDGLAYCFFGCLALFPLIAMYGLRYGIGTDYFSYEEIFNTLHQTSYDDYVFHHNNNENIYYVEKAYYFLNRFLPSYRLLLWFIGVCLFVLFLIAVRDYIARMSFAFALLVFLSTQFIYSLNGVRFVIALMLFLNACKALASKKPVHYTIWVLVATLFHKSLLLCLPLVVLMQFSRERINKIRDRIMVIGIISFPVIGTGALKALSRFSFFERYFMTEQYSSADTIGGSLTWALHVVPVLVPLLFCRRTICESDEAKVYLRICLMEIPFRMLGLYNSIYTRYARCSQIAQVLLIPLVLFSISNKRNRVIMYCYYVIWYVFYFAYYALVNDGGDSLPYVGFFL